MKSIAKAFNEVLIFFPYMDSVTYSSEGWEYNSKNDIGMCFPDELNYTTLKDGLNEWYNLNQEKNTFTKGEINFLEGWKCIDADNQQYCFTHSDNIFTYKEFIKFDENKGEYNTLPDGETLTNEVWYNSDLWTTETINFNDLTEDIIKKSIKPYYNTLDELKSIYGENWKQIVVECYFEQEFCGY